jgi:hypothetical protein
MVVPADLVAKAVQVVDDKAKVAQMDLGHKVAALKVNVHVGQHLNSCIAFSK